MIEDTEMEVRFDIYCATCGHKDIPEEKDPCHECLAFPSNINSRKPVNYKEKE